MSDHTQSSLPQIFKGIAVFTPGGDLIYGIDPSKQNQWHRHLCLGLQQAFQLSDPPHFLVPGYTATVERWLDPETQAITTIAEVYPAVQRYIPLLQVLFQLEMTTEWQIAPWQEEHCNRAIIETYQPRFARLWMQQNLILRQDPPVNPHHKILNYPEELTDFSPKDHRETYIFQLFIASSYPQTEHTLSNIHKILEEGLTKPYKLKVIDVTKNPEQADSHQILVTPTLIRLIPEPVTRVVGRLDDMQRVLDIITHH